MRGPLAAEVRQGLKASRKILKTANLTMHVGSVAIAVEALEAILTERGILKEDELMNRIRVIAQRHYETGKLNPVMDD